MVQHNNASSSSTPGVVGGHSTGGSSKGSRLLPYPPIVGEAELFHPKPRMGVGVGGLAGELENGLKIDGLEEGDGDVEGGDETTYHSALEIQTDIDESEVGGSGEGSTATAMPEEILGSGNDVETRVDATDGVEHPEKAKEEEEPNIQDLLLAPQSQTRPRVLSGVGSWEMELGETVKRISSNGSSATPATGSISSTGGTKTRTRPRKRELMGETGRINGNADNLSKKMMTGVLTSELFEAPNSVGNSAEGDNVDASVPFPGSAASSARQTALDERESKIAVLESSLNLRESSITERDALITNRESSIVDRESSIVERESSITERESSITDRESSLDIRESSITSRESTITKLESDVTARETALTTSESEIQRQMGDIQQREMEVEKREVEVEKRETEVCGREMRVEKGESEVGKREQEVSERETRVEKGKSEVEKRDQEVSERQTGVEKRESEVEEREQEISERQTRVEKGESEVEKREQEVSERETRVEEIESEVEKREQDISERETRVEKGGSEVEKREQDVSERETRVEEIESELEKREQEVTERETRVGRREVEVEEWYQRKLSEIDERLLVDAPTPPLTASAVVSSTLEVSTCTCTTAKSKWPASPMEFARRLCTTFLLPVLGKERTPVISLPRDGAANSSNFESSSSTTSSTSTTSITATTTSSSPSIPVPLWSLKLKRDLFLNRLLGATAGGGSFLVLVGIGICVIFLRGVVRKVLRVGPGGFGRR